MPGKSASLICTAGRASRVRGVREVYQGVWRGRRRLRLLESAFATAREDQAELQRRVDLFEKIAEAAGAALSDPASAAPAPPNLVPPDPVPASLLAAAWDPPHDGVPVSLAVNGRNVVAVIGDEGGDPREWWAAIRRLAPGLRSVS